MTLLEPLAERFLGSRTLAALTSPHGVDRYLELVNPMWAATEVRPASSTSPARPSGEHPVATITLQPTSTWRGHRAGQYVQVGVEINGARRTTRCFSISSAESGPGERFTHHRARPRRGPPGQQRVSRFLVARGAGPARSLHLSQAEGEFTLTESPATPTNNHLLMISGGSGITPVMSQRPHPAARRVRRQGQPQGDLPALRPLAGGPDLRRGAAPHRSSRTTTSTSTCASATTSSAPSRWPGWSRTTATPTPGPAVRRR